MAAALVDVNAGSGNSGGDGGYGSSTSSGGVTIVTSDSGTSGISGALILESGISLVVEFDHRIEYRWRWWQFAN